jgi:hypothetical protein
MINELEDELDHVYGFGYAFAISILFLLMWVLV